MSVWSTSAVCLDLSNSHCKSHCIDDSFNRLRGHNHHSSHYKNMSLSGDEIHNRRFLSWRKLQLSRAKLKASSKTSALLSGFAMVAMVELQLSSSSSSSPTKISTGVLISFAIITTLLVVVHMLALMISTCILPNIEAICSLRSINLVEESPHERLHWYIETAWAFSTLLGLLLFLAEIALLCYIRFIDTNEIAAWSATVIIVPILFLFLAFAIHFYRSLVTHKYKNTMSGLRELEMLQDQIDSGNINAHRNSGGDLLQDIHVV